MNIKHPKFLQRLTFCLGILFACDLLTFLWAEGQWFAEVGYLRMFWIRLGTQGLVGVVVVIISLGFLGMNGAIARRNTESAPVPEGDRPNSLGNMGIVRLLPLTLLGSLCVAGMLVYQGQLVAEYWRNGFDQPLTPLVELRLGKFWQVVQTWGKQVWQLALVGGIAIAILVSPQILLGAIAILMSLGFGLLLSEHWSTLLAASSPTAFNQTDPLFGQDISFYIFTLPAWELLAFWLMGLSALALLSISLIYFLSGDSLSQGNFTGFTRSQKRHLYGLGAVFLGVITFTNWLNRYRLLYQPDGVVFGAGFTNATLQLPAYNLLMGLGIIAAFMLLWAAATQRAAPQIPQGSPQTSSKSVRQRSAKPVPQKLVLQQFAFQKNLLPLWGIGVFIKLYRKLSL